MHQFDLKNKTAIITGGAQGFGLDIAKRFLKSGTKAIIWDIDEEELKKAVKAVSDPNLSYNVVDVSDFKNVKDTVDEITKSSNIDILINNAGITGSTSSLWDYDVVEPVIPALLIKISMFENFAISSTVSLTSLKLDTSTTLYERFGLSTELIAFFNSSSSISQIVVFTPDFKKRLAISKPKPCAPPVMIAVLLIKSNLCIKNYFLLRR